MTLDQLIEKAQQLREQFGGDVPVACWPYDGQAGVWASYFEDVSLEIWEDAPVIVKMSPALIEEKRTFAFFEKD